MADPNLVRIIDDLHGAESASLLLRLTESVAYVHAGELEDYTAIEAMADEERGHLRRLVELLDALDATPGPRRVQVASGSLHYNRPHVLLPLLIRDKERLIGEYEAAGRSVSGNRQAADVVSGILPRHRAHLDKLRAIQAKTKVKG
jgi:hypothetical protein